MLYVILTAISIAANAAVAVATLFRAKFVVATLGEVSLPGSWLPLLAGLQLCGAAGLLLGLLGVPAIGTAAAAGLVLFYLSAVVTHLRAGAYRSIPSPALFLTLAVATLVVTALR